MIVGVIVIMVGEMSVMMIAEIAANLAVALPTEPMGASLLVERNLCRLAACEVSSRGNRHNLNLPPVRSDVYVHS